MAYYRLYFLDGAGAHIRSFAQFEAASDRDAVAAAEAQRTSAAMELWCERRKVRRWEPLWPAGASRGLGAQLPT